MTTPKKCSLMAALLLMSYGVPQSYTLGQRVSNLFINTLEGVEEFILSLWMTSEIFLANLRAMAWDMWLIVYRKVRRFKKELDKFD